MNRFAKFIRDYSGAVFLIPIGIVLAIFSVFYFNFYNKTNNYPTVEATVTKVDLYEEEHTDGDTHYDATYTVYVRYEVAGKTYDTEYGVFSDMKKGDKVKVAYNPDKPEEAAQPASIIWLIGLIVLSVVFTCVGVIGVIKTKNKNKKLKIQEREWKNE